jgi:hypothetical protein
MCPIIIRGRIIISAVSSFEETAHNLPKANLDVELLAATWLQINIQVLDVKSVAGAYA